MQERASLVETIKVIRDVSEMLRQRQVNVHHDRTSAATTGNVRNARAMGGGSRDEEHRSPDVSGDDSATQAKQYGARSSGSMPTSRRKNADASASVRGNSREPAANKKQVWYSVSSHVSKDLRKDISCMVHVAIWFVKCSLCTICACCQVGIPFCN